MIRPITFDEQIARAKDDGGVYRSIYPHDGILWGCAVTTTSTQIEIASGLFTLCGRMIWVDGKTDFPLQEPIQNGYAQLKAKIDLNNANTQEECAQFSAEVLYSTTTSFPELIQEDINNTGKKYEQELAVVKIENGNITGITRKLAGAGVDAEKLGGQLPGYYKNDYLVIHGQVTTMQAGVDTSLAAATVDVNDSPFVWDSGTNALWGDNTVPYRYARVHIDLSISGGVKLGFVSVGVAGTMINPNKSGALSYSTYFSEATGKSMMIGGDFFVALQEAGSLQFTAQQNGAAAQTAGMRVTVEFIK